MRWFCGHHAKRLSANPGAQIVGLCDVSRDITQGYLGKHLSAYGPAPVQFTDPAEMYRVTEPDAVFICTPHTLHAEHAMHALDAGCHVFLEKPMVTAADDAYLLADKVKQTDKILVVGYNTPCTPEFSYIRESIRAGELGAAGTGDRPPFPGLDEADHGQMEAGAEAFRRRTGV